MPYSFSNRLARVPLASPPLLTTPHASTPLLAVSSAILPPNAVLAPGGASSSHLGVRTATDFRARS